MSKILIVEPHKMLQRAMALAFFPDHEVELTDTFPEAWVLQNSYDLIVIDAASLREKNGPGDEMSLVQSWRIPTIWLEEADSAYEPVREKLVILRNPLSKNDLVSAMAGLISASTPATGPDFSGKDNDARVAKNTIDAAPDGGLHAQQSGIIELVDVVEETSGQTREKTRARKKN